MMKIPSTTNLFLIAAGLSLGLVTVQGAESDFSVTTDHVDGVYRSGEKAVFTIQYDGDVADAPATSYKLTHNRWDTIESADGPASTTPLEVSYDPPPGSGWYVCWLNLSETKKGTASAGVVYDPESFKPSHPMPEDFVAFWDGQKARLAASPVTPVLTPLTPEQRELECANPDHRNKIESLEKQGFTAMNLEIPCLDVMPVRGYYVLPPDAAAGNKPALLFVRAAGVSGGWCRSSLVYAMSMAEKYNAIVLDINAHGMLNGQPQSYYDDLDKGELNDYIHQGNKSRDNFYFLGMFLRLQRALDFLCDQPEWNGKQLICYGTSQGGAQSLAAAGLDSRVTAVVAVVPGMCDITAPAGSGWPGLVGDISEEDRTAIDETMRYFDMTNFCALSEAETLITVGLVDTSCSPPGVYAAYNQLREPKRIIPVPSGGHHGLSVSTRELNKQYDAFILEHMKN